MAPKEFTFNRATRPSINLGQRISIELQQATIQQLMQAAFEPLGMTYKIVGNQVLLTAREK